MAGLESDATHQLQCSPSSMSRACPESTGRSTEPCEPKDPCSVSMSLIVGRPLLGPHLGIRAAGDTGTLLLDGMSAWLPFILYTTAFVGHMQNRFPVQSYRQASADTSSMLVYTPIQQPHAQFGRHLHITLGMRSCTRCEVRLLPQPSTEVYSNN